MPPRKLNGREILSKKKERKKKPSSPSLTPLYFFKRDQLLHFFLRSQSTPARAWINLSTPPPPSTLPLLCIPYTIHTHDPLRIFDRNLSVGNCGDGSHRPRHEAEFSSFKGDKGRWLRAWHKNPGHPFEKRNKQGRKEGERDANRRTNGRASQDKSNIGVIRS